MTVKLSLSAAAMFLALNNGNAYAVTATEQLDTLLSEHWQKANKEQIFFRKDPDTFRMNGKLPDVSAKGRERREQYNAQLLKRLDSIDERELSEADKVTLRLFRYERQTEAQSYKQFDHLFPMQAYAGYHSYFAAAPDNMSFLTQADYDNYLISLADFPRYNQQHIDNLKQAIAKGYTHYCESFKSYDKTISQHIVDNVSDSVFYAPLSRQPAQFSPQQQNYYTEQGSKLIEDTVIPEYKKLYQFFTQQYMPACRKQVGIAQLEDGAPYYQYLINFYTTTSMTPEQIHQLGLNEVKRIRSEMDTIIKQVGFDGSFADFVHFLRTDPQFYASSGQQLMEKAAFITRKMAGQLPKWFNTLPRNTFDIKASPSGGAYYVASDGSGTTSGTYFIGANDVRSEPLYNLEALTFHEAEPGHHLQSALAQEMDIPEFRKTLYHSAYGEGWGLYAESLGKEMGFYQDPYSDFGRLTYEAWRACRLVVDTGMHALGWSRQQAIDYLAANTALTMVEVEAQIDRYITWPAQALSYKIGEIKIRQLRTQAEQQLGDKFDIRAFHDQMLKNGSLPLDLLEQLTLEWINTQK
ncbi:DUF885 domain-containing protein [Rheinheimera aquimaris]|uniref:DUF885 domain-containing protein n=1 Tax=Rheinheimera aquimaris TaxID=412437 RepID=A0ABN1DBU4_9GAMM|nr:DUF885 domain-containing protein [Rheinheimera aquimaris]MCB5212464.1 DUF885 domain-containing protein [Rheinheimera aquimaris]